MAAPKPVSGKLGTAAPGVRVVSREWGLDATARQVTRALLTLLQGPLTGAFVTDARLLDAARIPFTREVGHLSGVARPLDHEDMQRLLRRRAQVFQAELAAMAGDLQRPWHCEQCGGDAIAHAVQALREPGAVVITTAARSQAPSTLSGRGISVVLPEGDGDAGILRAGQELGRQLGVPIRIHRLAPRPVATRTPVASTPLARWRIGTHANIVLVSSSALPQTGGERADALARIGGLVVLITALDDLDLPASA